MSRVKRISAQNESLDRANFEMEQRLTEIKGLFEKEKSRREREALNWASAGDGSTKKGTKKGLDSQSRKILGKGYDRGIKFKVLKDTPLDVAKRPEDQDVRDFIANEKSKIDRRSKKKLHTRYSPKTSSPPKHSPMGASKQTLNEPIELYVLLSDISNSEIFELPLTPQGDLGLNIVKTVASSRSVGVYTIRDGRKRLMPADSSGIIIRPATGWGIQTYFPLIPPRSSRPTTPRSVSVMSTARDFSLKPLSPRVDPSGYTPRNVESMPANLMYGSYDEAAAAREFQQAVANFRETSGSSSSRSMSQTQGTTTEPPPHEIPLSNKLSQVEQMFQGKSNISAFERAYLDQARTASRMIASQYESNENDAFDEYEPTEEDLELEEERNEFRAMLIGSISQDEPTVEASTRQLTPPSGQPIDLGPMWMPTPNIQLAMDSVAGSESSIEEIQRPDLQSRIDEYPPHQVGEDQLYSQTVQQTFYSDGTVVNNVMTVELSNDYDAEEDYDFEENNMWQEELLRQQTQDLIDSHARRYSQEMEQEPPRPASRGSIITDDDLADNVHMTNMLNHLESKYLPDNDDY